PPPRAGPTPCPASQPAARPAAQPPPAACRTSPARSARPRRLGTRHMDGILAPQPARNHRGRVPDPVAETDLVVLAQEPGHEVRVVADGVADPDRLDEADGAGAGARGPVLLKEPAQVGGVPPLDDKGHQGRGVKVDHDSDSSVPSSLSQSGSSRSSSRIANGSTSSGISRWVY